MASNFDFGEDEFQACCGSSKFAREMVSASPFSSLEQAVAAARHIWFNQVSIFTFFNLFSSCIIVGDQSWLNFNVCFWKVDVNGWLEAFSAHPQIGQASKSSNQTSAQLRFS